MVRQPAQATLILLIRHRDSEESAPAEYPPDQPEADELEDDSGAYGAEEAEMQEALERELEEVEAKTEVKDTNGDHDMGEEPKSKEEDEESEAGSEDLEAESSDDDEEEDEEEGEGDEDMEMGEADEKAQATEKSNGEQKPANAQGQPEVMVH